jgi:hypothetical protein
MKEPREFKIGQKFTVSFGRHAQRIKIFKVYNNGTIEVRQLGFIPYYYLYHNAQELENDILE